MSALFLKSLSSPFIFPVILEIIYFQSFPYRADFWRLLVLHFCVRVAVHQFILKQQAVV